MARFNCKGDKLSPFYRPFGVGNLPTGCMLLREVLWAASDHCSTTTDNSLQKGMPKRQALLHSTVLLEREYAQPFLTSPENCPLEYFSAVPFPTETADSGLPLQFPNSALPTSALTRPNAPFQSINNNAGNKGGDFRLSFTGTRIANLFS